MTTLPALNVENLNAVEVFVPGGAIQIVNRIREDVTKEVFDVTTKNCRDRIASVAHKIAKSKIYLVAEQAEKQRVIDEARAANKSHKAKIHNEALVALAAVMGSPDFDAKAIVIAIAEGKIPHITINY